MELVVTYLALHSYKKMLNIISATTEQQRFNTQYSYKL